MKIAIGLSGGVDSSVAACVLKEQGHEVIGVTMKLWNGKYKGGHKDACFSPDEDKDIEVASNLCRKIGIPYHVFDCSEEYDKTIIEYFRNSYANGTTPNPCVRCNSEFKFGLLPDLASKKLGGFDKFATGHYARIVDVDNRLRLKIASCGFKDQTYFLSKISQSKLANIVFPLGDVESKESVREIAKKYELDMADKADSMDFYSGDISELIGKEDKVGYVEYNGKVIGTHNGHWHFTIGQRKGFNITDRNAPKVPLYVTNINSCHNVISVDTYDNACKSKFKVSNINWFAEPGDTCVNRIKLRSNGKFHEGRLIHSSGEVIMNEDVFGVTPGQQMVMYDANDCVVCSGTIELV